MKKICVFCGARKGNNYDLIDSIKEVARICAENNITVICGGSVAGLMGVITESVISNGGHVIGIFPDILEARETTHPRLTTLVRTQCMSSRKQMMSDMADCFLILPGGYGTMDELFEVIVLRQLKESNKPIILFNYDGFWNGILDQISRTIKNDFISEESELPFLIVHNSNEFEAIIGELAKVT